MSVKVGEAFVNYALLKIIIRAFKARVFEEMGDVSEDEERHVSELERRMKALDEKEVFIAVSTFVKHHRKTVVKTLEFIEKEGEKDEQRNND